ncbi:MAG: type II toxin-antitoxin system HicB family antitoxin [Snowella sp.]|nr:type II toxin-antitoxin system HicB family antitoxin [Snowella sp.]
MRDARISRWANNNYFAYVPDLPGCVSTGKSLESIKTNIQEAIALYIDTLREEGQAIPEPSVRGKLIAV